MTDHPDQAAWRLARAGRYAEAAAALADRPLERARLAGAVGWSGVAYAAALEAIAADPTAPEPLLLALELALGRRQMGLAEGHQTALAQLGAHNVAAAGPAAPVPRSDAPHRWRGEWPTAIALAEATLADNPASSEALLTLGLARIAADDWSGALPWLDRALAADPRLAEAYAWRAEAQFRRGDVGAAHRELDQATVCADGFSLAAALLRLHISPAGANAGRLDPVLPALCALDPAIAAAQGAQRHQLAQQAIAPTLAALAWNRSTTVTLGSGDQLRPVELPASARHRCRQALEQAYLLPQTVEPTLLDLVAQCPDSSLPLAYLGEWRLWLGNLAGAEAALQAAIAQWRQTRWAYAGLATVALLRGDLDQAERWLDTGRQVMGDEGPPWVVLRGELAWLRGQLPQAKVLLLQAVARQSTRMTAWVLLGLCQRDAGDVGGLAATWAHLTDCAPGMCSDASAVDPEPGAALQALRAMVHGCRSSSMTVYTTGDAVRVVRSEPGRAAAVARMVAGRVARFTQSR